MSISMDTIIKKSENVVFRKIQDEYILVPIVASAADVESIFILNETGAAVWEMIDGVRKLSDIVGNIKSEYESEGEQTERDIMAFVDDMMEARVVGV